MPNWLDYSRGAVDGHLYMQLLPELADLSGELTTVVMQSNKMMIVLYQMFGLQFLHAKHIHGCFRHKPGYMCKSWVMLNKHGMAVFLDQAMLPTELTSSQQLQFVHFPKSSMTAWGLDGHTFDQRMQSIFWQKKVNALELCNKPNQFLMWYNLLAEASFMVVQLAVSLSRLEANHKVLCLRHTITSAGVECMDQILFEDCNVPGESQDLATNQLQGKLRDRLNCCIELEMLTREGHDRPLLACGQVLLDTDYLANLVRPSAADLVDHAV